MAYTGTKAQTGLGTTIGIGATPTIIGESITLSLSGDKWDTADTTNLQSLGKEFINTIQDGGEWSVEGSRVSSDAGQIAVETAFASGAISSFTIQLPKAAAQSTTGDKYIFNALIQERDFKIEPTKNITFSLKLKVSGLMAMTPGT